MRDAARPGAVVEDPYVVLGVATNASHEAIRQAYRSRARVSHPDVTREPEAAARFRRLAAAYEILGDPQRRRAYDADRNAVGPDTTGDERRTGPVAVHRAPGPTGAVVTPPRAADVWARSSKGGSPAEAREGARDWPRAETPPPREASMEEWRVLSILGRFAAAAVLLVVVGVTVIALLSAIRDDEPMSPTPFCRTPDGWIDCRRVLDPLTP